jgi:hypothetical protein
VYARAIDRILVRRGETPESARKRFDHSLMVGSWVFPGNEPVEPRSDGAPWWWDGDEEASSTFLASMGVTLE